MKRMKYLLQALLSVTLVALTLGSIGVSSASAGIDDWCHPSTAYWGGLSSNHACTGPNHTYNSIVARSQEITNISLGICAGAINSNTGGQYGSYICSNDWACHTYGAGTMLNGVVWNRDTGYHGVRGQGSYGVDGPFNGCPRGTYVGYDKSTKQSRTALRKTFPVFARANAGPKPPADVLTGMKIAADPDGVRSFGTVAGTGWVTVDSRHGEICLLFEDGGTGYGLTCGRKQAVLDKGIEAAVIPDRKSDAATASDVTLTPAAGDGSTGLTVESVKPTDTGAVSATS